MRSRCSTCSCSLSQFRCSNRRRCTGTWRSFPSNERRCRCTRTTSLAGSHSWRSRGSIRRSSGGMVRPSPSRSQGGCRCTSLAAIDRTPGERSSSFPRLLRSPRARRQRQPPRRRSRLPMHWSSYTQRSRSLSPASRSRVVMAAIGPWIGTLRALPRVHKEGILTALLRSLLVLQRPAVPVVVKHDSRDRLHTIGQHKTVNQPTFASCWPGYLVKSCGARLYRIAFYRVLPY